MGVALGASRYPFAAVEERTAAALLDVHVDGYSNAVYRV